MAVAETVGAGVVDTVAESVGEGSGVNVAVPLPQAEGVALDGGEALAGAVPEGVKVDDTLAVAEIVTADEMDEDTVSVGEDRGVSVAVPLLQAEGVAVGCSEALAAALSDSVKVDDTVPVAEIVPKGVVDVDTVSVGEGIGVSVAVPLPQAEGVAEDGCEALAAAVPEDV